MKKSLNHFVRFTLTCIALCLTAHCYGAVSQQILHSFGTSTNDGLMAFAGLVQGRDGALYGTTLWGGSNGVGTVFKLNPNGTGYTSLYHFLTNGIDGQPVKGALVYGQDGKLYGMTSGGGTNVAGTVFRINTNGTGYQVLHSFPYGSIPDGYNAEVPVGNLMQAADGMLYGLYITGVHHNGGLAAFKLSTEGLGYEVIRDLTSLPYLNIYAGFVQGRDGALYGTTDAAVYKLGTNGLDFALLHSFSNVFYIDPAVTNVDGFVARAPLIHGTDGMLYGTTSEGGRRTANNIYGYGTVFKLSPSGTDYQLIHVFGTNDAGLQAEGLIPIGGLVQGSDGALYGTTSGGGAHQGGNVFKLNPDGTGFRVLYDFVPGGSVNDAWGPEAALVQGRDGAFYGTTPHGRTTGYGAVLKFGGDFALLNSLGAVALGPPPIPSGAMAQGGDGTLYGTTRSGGSNNVGAVFRVNPNGVGYAVIYSFSTDTNGFFPAGGLLSGQDGWLYGTTALGGNGFTGGGPSGNPGAGTVFKLNTNGLGYAAIYRFQTNGNDGQHPSAPLIQTSDGTLYGTTPDGGSNNVGTAFKLNSSGTSYAVLYHFKTNGNDGQFPGGGLLQGQDGGLYGTTGNGGSNNAGTVFKLGTNGSGYIVLHHFSTNGSDGQNPEVGLVQSSEGNFYGTTPYGGSDDLGTVFKLGANGAGYVVLHHFSTNDNDGQKPSAPLTQASDGALYGTTLYGGNSGFGTVFKLNTSGSGYTVVHSFNGFDGEYPETPLLLGSDGALYGTTFAGGANSKGTVFRLSVTPGYFASFSILPDRAFQFSLTGGNLDYRIDASTDLVSWVTLTNIVNTAGAVQFTDHAASNFPKRFYRKVWVP